MASLMAALWASNLYVIAGLFGLSDVLLRRVLDHGQHISRGLVP